MRHGFRLALFVVVIYLPFLILCAVVAWMSARGILPDLADTNVVLFIPMAGMVAVLCAILFVARRQLRGRFLEREAISFEQWFKKYYSNDDVSPEGAQQILELLAKGIGRDVQPTQILPTDRLDEDFTYRLLGAAIDRGELLANPIEYLLDELPERVDFDADAGHADSVWVTVDDVIHDVSAHFEHP